jgi:hypothetical protein
MSFSPIRSGPPSPKSPVSVSGQRGGFATETALAVATLSGQLSRLLPENRIPQGEPAPAQLTSEGGVPIPTGFSHPSFTLFTDKTGGEWVRASDAFAGESWHRSTSIQDADLARRLDLGAGHSGTPLENPPNVKGFAASGLPLRTDDLSASVYRNPAWGPNAMPEFIAFHDSWTGKDTWYRVESLVAKDV